MTPLLVAAGIVLVVTALLTYSLCVIAKQSDAAAQAIQRKRDDRE